MEEYNKNGYVVINNLLSATEVENLKSDMLKICRGEKGNIKGLIECSASDTDEEVLKRYLAIHFPHKISDIVLQLLKNHSKTNKILTEIIGPNVKSMQSIMFMKGPGKTGQAWHQDEFYIPTRDRSLTATWIALDDATIENGCLWVIPGSHKRGILYPMKAHNDKRFDPSKESFDFPHSDSDAVPVELKAGGCIFFNGYLLHRSLQNSTTTSFRRAFANHYMSAESFLPWNWDTRIPGYVYDLRDIIMVTGVDPYNYKGIESITYPYIRAATKQEHVEKNFELNPL